MAPSKRHKSHGRVKPIRVKKERLPGLLEFLPEGALFVIAESLAEVGPGGVRGPSLVSRDLCSLGMTCKALRSASQHGIQALAQQVLHRLQQSKEFGSVLWRLPHTDAAAAAATAAEVSRAAAAAAAARVAAALEGEDLQEAADDWDLLAGTNDIIAVPPLQQAPQMIWSFWDALLPDISAGTCSRNLKVHATLLGTSNPTMRAQASRETVEAAVLGAFGLSRCTKSVPAVLLVACKREQRSDGMTGDGPDNCAGLHAALKRLADLSREVWLPLGLQAQRWGYGRRRPPSWQKHTVLPANQKGVAWALPGGLATIRIGLAAAGIHSLQQLQQLVASEVEEDTRRRAALAAAAGLATERQQPPQLQQQQQQRRQKAVSQAWKQARQQAGRQRLAEAATRLWGQVMCSTPCGSIAAKWCLRQCCGDCCRKAAAAAGPDAELCVRHKDRQSAADEAAAAAIKAAAVAAAADPAAGGQPDAAVVANA